MSADLLRALESDDPVDLQRFCRVTFATQRETFGRIVPMALSGNRAAASVYVATWRELKNSVLGAIHDVQPDLVLDVNGQLLVVDVKRFPALASTMVLEAEALEAPFSSWITAAGDVGVGTCAALIQKVREVLPGFHPIALNEHALPHWEQTEVQIRAFRRHVSSALGETDSSLERIRAVFDLSLTELGELFGVTRQAVTQWLESGIPEDRLTKVATVAAIADLLDYRLRSERIPGIVRKAASAYEGRTALEMIKQNQHEALLEATRESFAWTIPA